MTDGHAADPVYVDGTGDRTFAAVFGAEHAGLVRLAHLLTGSNELAEDVVQQAFATALPRWATLDNPAAYVRTAVVNGCRSAHRRRGTESRLGRLVASDPVAAAAPDGELWDALATLPWRQRAALVLRFYEDRTTEQVAEALGCRPGTARSLLSRGLATLRKELS